MSTPRIVVTGIGASHPIGGTAPESWSALLAGVSGARTLEYDWVEQYQLPVTFAAEALVRPDTVLERPVAKRLDPSSQFALVAAQEAWADAGSPEVDPERFGVDFATGIGGAADPARRLGHAAREGPAPRHADDASRCSCRTPPAAAVSMHLGARAYARTVASACASSTESIVNAFEHLRLGLRRRRDRRRHRSRRSTRLTIAAFASMQALSKRNDSPETRLAPVQRRPRRLRHGRGRRVPSSSRPRSTRRPAARRSTRESSAAASPPIRTTSPLPSPRASARRARCAWRSRQAGRDRPTTSRTSTRTRPRRRPATSPSTRRCLSVFGDRIARDPRLGHEGLDRPPARRHRRARGDLHDPRAARRVRRRRRSTSRRRTPRSRCASRARRSRSATGRSSRSATRSASAATTPSSRSRSV